MKNVKKKLFRINKCINLLNSFHYNFLSSNIPRLSFFFTTRSYKGNNQLKSNYLDRLLRAIPE